MSYLLAPEFVQKIIIIVFIVIMIIEIVNLFLSVICNNKPSYTSLLSFLFVFMMVLNLTVSEIKSDGTFVQKMVYNAHNMPLVMMILLCLIMGAASIIELVLLYRWTKKHLSSMSIKESLDTLPTGICIFENSGLPRLVNQKMNDLCMLVTNKTLLNANEFWNILTNENNKNEFVLSINNDKPLIKLPDDSVYLFSRYEYQIEKENMYEIVAVDITKKYKLSLDLQKRNEELLLFNKRMYQYGENIDQYIIEKEMFEAKLYIHDELGELLIATTKSLRDELTSIELADLLKKWDEVLNAFEVGKNRKLKDSYGELEKAASQIGVKIVYEGFKPDDKIVQKILFSAAVECMMNTVIHAKGDIMYITVDDSDGYINISIKNNGQTPAKEIKEGGGFSSLRLLVESNGGVMIITSIPCFELKIMMRKEYYEK